MSKQAKVNVAGWVAIALVVVGALTFTAVSGTGHPGRPMPGNELRLNVGGPNGSPSTYGPITTYDVGTLPPDVTAGPQSDGTCIHCGPGDNVCRNGNPNDCGYGDNPGNGNPGNGDHWVNGTDGQGCGYPDCQTFDGRERVADFGLSALASGTNTLANAAATTYPLGLPPYWHRQAPRNCYEDNACWIGSTADSRTDAQSYAAWTQVLMGSYQCIVAGRPRCIDLYHRG